MPPLNAQHSSTQRSGEGWRRGRHLLLLYALLAPTVIGLVWFSYYPKISAIRYAFYDWSPGVMLDYVGLRNFVEALHDHKFMGAIRLTLLLLLSNLVKMWPAIFAAIALHRLRRARSRYFFEVLVVLPMIVPAMVWALLWKGFMDPTVGLINVFLNASGLMSVLNGLDSVLYRVADVLYPVAWCCDQLFSAHPGAYVSVSSQELGARMAGYGWVGLIGVGWACHLAAGGREVLRKNWLSVGVVVGVGGLVSGWRMGVWLLLVAGLMAFWRKDGCRGYGGLQKGRRLAWGLMGFGGLLAVLTRCWTHYTGAFAQGTPAWLGHSDLVVPSLIFWGFPWIATTGVLIYLAGLQQIDDEVYESARLDGLGSMGILFRIELPLLLTQVRINLVFMTIATLNSYALFLLMLGPDGGPAGKGLVPGLYMYQQAFERGRFGYACALGLFMFAVILVMTVIYHRSLRVEK